MIRIVLVTAMILVASGCAGNWSILQLTDNDYDDYESDISGSRVAWISDTGDVPRGEMYLCDDGRIKRLAGTLLANRTPDVSETAVAWVGSRVTGPGDPIEPREVALYDGEVTRQLSVGVGATSVHVSGPCASWAGSDWGGDLEVFLYDGTRVVQLTQNDYVDDYPDLSGTNVVWRGASQIFFYDGETVRQISGDDYLCYGPRISGSYVAWTAAVGEQTEVFFYDGATVTRVTDNVHNDQHVQIDGTHVVWQGFDGNDWEIFLYDGQALRQITDNDYDDVEPEISGSNVAWTAMFPGGNASDIFFYDGRTITRLTHDDLPDRVGGISGSTVLYEHHDGNDWELLLATRPDEALAPQED